MLNERDPHALAALSARLLTETMVRGSAMHRIGGPITSILPPATAAGSLGAVTPAAAATPVARIIMPTRVTHSMDEDGDEEMAEAGPGDVEDGRAEARVLAAPRGSSDGVREAAALAYGQRLDTVDEGDTDVEDGDLDEAEDAREGLRYEPETMRTPTGRAAAKLKWVNSTPMEFTSHEQVSPRAGKRRRITDEQLATLESCFRRDPLPKLEQREHLAETLGMTPRSVQVWFQNRRQSRKKRRASERGAAAHGTPRSSSYSAFATPRPDGHEDEEEALDLLLESKADRAKAKILSMLASGGGQIVLNPPSTPAPVPASKSKSSKRAGASGLRTPTSQPRAKRYGMEGDNSAAEIVKSDAAMALVTLSSAKWGDGDGSIGGGRSDGSAAAAGLIGAVNVGGFYGTSGAGQTPRGLPSPAETLGTAETPGTPPESGLRPRRSKR
ncbi:hypothetical protein HK101_011273 [Irineochytrium annulatum]|nr:hypothetical protein HK101_011273 [Irineochytrium annulatum]